jgi:acyl carrier protein
VTDDVEKRTLKVIAEVFGTSPAKLSRKTRFVEDLHTKSIDIIEMLGQLELEFGVSVPASETRNNKTVGQAVDYMVRKMKQRKKQ